MQREKKLEVTDTEDEDECHHDTRPDREVISESLGRVSKISPSLHFSR